MKLYDLVSPLDFRYYGADPAFSERLRPYASEGAFIGYQARVEKALVQAFADLGWCSPLVARDVGAACDAVTPAEVYEEEKRTAHNVRALVNCIARRVSPDAARFVHLFATSNDITDTATALRFQELVRDVVLPDLLDLQSVLIGIARAHASTPQIGRTHGRHAEPITFGFALALYVDRLGGRICAVEDARQNLRGKLAGAVGAYNALSLQLPRAAVLFEALVLARLGLQPAPASVASQIVQPEYLADLGYAAHACFGVLANLADDVRHLHRSEIAEVLEEQGAEAVGSSTMPHKVNPKSFENVKSLWKAFAPRVTTLLMDQISEHQRDLTNSASQRFLIEVLVALDYCAVRTSRAMWGLRIDPEAMRRNLNLARDHIVAEPLYVLLALQGYPSAYERVRAIARAAREQGRPVLDVARKDPEVGPRLAKLAAEQVAILEDPASKYTGQAAERTKAACARWEREGAALRDYLQKEKAVLGSVTAERLSELHREIREIEGRKTDASDLCPARDRKALIEAWIEQEGAGKSR